MATITLDRSSPTGSAERSPHRHATYPPDYSRAEKPAYLVLQAAGFSMPLPLPTTRCALTAPFHPYLCCKQPSAVYFLWHCPAGRPGRSLAAAAPYPARTFLWMSFNPAAARPTQPTIIPQNQTFENDKSPLPIFPKQVCKYAGIQVYTF